MPPGQPVSVGELYDTFKEIEAQQARIDQMKTVYGRLVVEEEKEAPGRSQFGKDRAQAARSRLWDDIAKLETENVKLRNRIL